MGRWTSGPGETMAGADSQCDEDDHMEDDHMDDIEAGAGRDAMLFQREPICITRIILTRQYYGVPIWRRD